MLILIVSCHQEDKKIPPLKFPSSYNLVGKQVLQEFVTITALHSVDNYLITVLQNEDYYFQIFDSKSLSSLGKFGRRGDGPNEITGYLTYSYYELADTNYNIWFYNRNRCELIKITFPKKFNLNKIEINKIKLNQKANFNYAFLIDTNKVVGNVVNSDVKMDLLRIYNLRMNNITKRVPLFPEIPKHSRELGHITNTYNGLFVGSAAFQKEQQKVVLALGYFNRIDIFNTKAELIHTIQEENINSSKVISGYLSTTDIRETDIKRIYSGLQTSKENIYVLYINKYLKDYEKPSQVEIRVFDWDGIPIKKYVIPEYIWRFTIDEAHDKIYGIDYNSRDVYMYDLSTASND